MRGNVDHRHIDRASGDRARPRGCDKTQNPRDLSATLQMRRRSCSSTASSHDTATSLASAVQTQRRDRNELLLEVDINVDHRLVGAGVQVSMMRS